MAKILKKTQGGKTYIYIIGNKRFAGKNKRVYLESLGVLGKDTTMRKAEFALAKHTISGKTIRNEEVTFEKAVEDFSATYKETANKETFRSFKFMSDLAKTFFGCSKLGSISYQDIQGFKDFLLKKDWGNRSINIALIELKKLFKHELRCGRVDAVPIIEALPDIKTHEVHRLTLQEVKKLYELANDKQKKCLTLFLQTGMRPYEAERLLWDDIYLKEGYISIKSSRSNKRGRNIPISKKLLVMLKAEKVKAGRVSPYGLSVAKKQLSKLSTKSGINFTAYTLRKTFVSALLENGVSLFEVAKITGHSDIQTLYRYYTGLQFKTLESAMAQNPL